MPRADVGTRGLGPLTTQHPVGKRRQSELIGTTIAERLKEKGITKVVFDRNGFLYHGRVRAVAEAARSAGLEF